MKKFVWTIIAALTVFVSACDNDKKENDGEQLEIIGKGGSMNLATPAFQNGGKIPQKYSYDGGNLSVPLEWGGLPEKTVSIAVICDDPDAPGNTWVHWVIYNIPASEKGLPEGISADRTLPSGAIQGKNSWGKIGYGGPQPPSGSHRYFFKVYALNTMLNLPSGAGKSDLMGAMTGHILANAEVMGIYSR